MKSNVRVIGCLKTIDGDLQNKNLIFSFLFDTTTKVFAEAIGNLCSDFTYTKE